jgi:Tfp pilus assembly protein PilF
VLGFAYLTEVKTDFAAAAFERAITLDSADPLPRLGMGLAQIRDGDLESGGRNVEIAASLDPENALVRSYLGKVYFEEKRGKLDEREYATAKTSIRTIRRPGSTTPSRSRRRTVRSRRCATSRRRSS